MRRFRFTPRYCQSNSDLDMRENGKHQLFSQICRDHPACGCAPAYSSWNCDGEILTHTAIDVRYRDPLGASPRILVEFLTQEEFIFSFFNLNTFSFCSLFPRVHCQLIKLFARGIEDPMVFEDLPNPCAI